VTSPAEPRRLPPAAAGRALEFRNVSFHYPPRDGAEPRWVLRDVSFSLRAGDTLGVVGATGSGKSALMDLIPRLADPQRGEILLDGVPIRELTLDELRAEIGYVPQESLLFSDTIEANLTYGLRTGAPAGAPPGDGAGDSRGDGAGHQGSDGAHAAGVARQAAAIAQIDDTVRAFPGGYDTLLGERGINLSGGQKQRVALARALARRPSVVLLDDALSAVDTHTEAAILRTLRDDLARRTAVIASHRVSAIRDASWIIVLDEGRVVEQGRHEELLALGGRYWSLLSRQQLVEAIEAEGDGGDGGDGSNEPLAADEPGATIPT
jgi:ATP-binding cassette subfamily B protein